jgi:hypothetical protein
MGCAARIGKSEVDIECPLRPVVRLCLTIGRAHHNTLYFDGTKASITEIFLRGPVTEDEMSAGVDGGTCLPYLLGSGGRLWWHRGGPYTELCRSN